MKKIYYAVCTVLSIGAMFVSCKGFELKPEFVSIFGSEEKGITLESYNLGSNNAVVLVFSEKVSLNDITVQRADGSEVLCSVQSEIGEDNKQTSYVQIIDTIGIGESFTLSGSVKCGLTTQDFKLNFIGKNTDPAQLYFTEYKPDCHTKTVHEDEFIEATAIKSGNLSGFVIRNIGTKNMPDYVFPPCEVVKGDIVLIELRTTEETRGTYSRIGKVHCFYAPWDKPVFNKTNVVVCNDEDEKIMDYVVYVREKQINKEYTPDENFDVMEAVNWDRLKPLVKNILESNCADNFIADVQHQLVPRKNGTKTEVGLNVTKTVSVVRDTREQGSQKFWTVTKNITRGTVHE